MVDSGCPRAAKLPLQSEWQVRSSLPFFFILHLLCKVKEVTVGLEFEGKGEDVTVKLLSLLQIKIYILGKRSLFWFNELAVFLKVFQKTVAQWVCVPLLLHCRQLVMLCRRSDLSPTDGAELCGCVNTGDSMAWCCLGVRHPLKAPRTPQSNEQ